jgi:hypothetical protein
VERVKGDLFKKSPLTLSFSQRGGLNVKTGKLFSPKILKPYGKPGSKALNIEIRQSGNEIERRILPAKFAAWFKTQ